MISHLLTIFLLSLFASIIIIWLISYLFDLLFGRAIDNANFYFKSVKNVDEPWPRITGAKPRAVDRLVGWAGVRRFFVQPVWIGFVFLAVFAGLVFSLGSRGILLWFLGLLGLTWFILYRANRRKRGFVRNFPGALDALTQSLRAGYSLPQAIAFVAKETTGPVRQVLSALNRSTTYKIPLKDAILAIKEELRSPEWDLLAEVILLQERTGGNIVPVIASVASTIRQNSAIEQEVHTATASGRLSGMLIAGLVPVAFLIYLFFSPAYLNVFFTNGLGRLLLVLVVALETVGFLLIRKITKVSY